MSKFLGWLKTVLRIKSGTAELHVYSDHHPVTGEKLADPLVFEVDKGSHFYKNLKKKAKKSS